MENPFKFGVVVRGEDFFDRDHELDELRLAVQSAQRLFLISSRRYGKTSLLLNFLESLDPTKYISVYIDFFRISSKKMLVEQLGSAYGRCKGKRIETFIDTVKSFMGNLRPKFTVQPDGTPGVTIDYTPRDTEIDMALQAIVDAPGDITRDGNRRMVVVFDEFQEIVNLDGTAIEKLMRSSIQRHGNVAYLFSGSKRHIILDMIAEENRAFYKMGKIMHLQKLPTRKFKTHILNKFLNSGIDISEDVISLIFQAARENPFNIQYLSSELWEQNRTAGNVTPDKVGDVLRSIVGKESPLYEKIWDGLSGHQKILLRALSRGEVRNIFSRSFIEENELRSAGSIRTSLQALLKKNIVQKEEGAYLIEDPFFGTWIRSA